MIFRYLATLADGFMLTKPTAAWQWHQLTDSRDGEALPPAGRPVAGHTSSDPSAPPVALGSEGHQP